MSLQTTTRYATLDDLATLLQEQHVRQLDVVLPADAYTAAGGLLVIEGQDPIVTEDGVTDINGRYRPTQVCDEGLGKALGIHTGYLKGTRERGRPDIWDANVNGWLHGDGGDNGPDKRSFLARMFKPDESGEGVARAWVSNKFRKIDNLDTLFAVMRGIQNSGQDVQVTRCSLSERRMYIEVHAPGIAGYAPLLLAGYKNPFDDEDLARDVAKVRGMSVEHWREVAEREGMGYARGQEPVVFAGFEVTNSEVGQGQFSIDPKLRIEICGNGLTIGGESGAISKRHVGGLLEDGIVTWSEQTQRKALELVASQAEDAVRTFLSEKYLTGALERVEAQAGAKIKPKEITQKAEIVASKLSFTKAEMAGVLAHFIAGEKRTAGGMAMAITSYSQTVPDADRAHELDARALEAMALVQ